MGDLILICVRCVLCVRMFPFYIRFIYIFKYRVKIRVFSLQLGVFVLDVEKGYVCMLEMIGVISVSVIRRVCTISNDFT